MAREFQTQLWFVFCYITLLLPTVTDACALHDDCDHTHQHLPHVPLNVEAGPPKKIPFLAEAPLSGVNITSNHMFSSIMQDNIDYLLTSFDTDHLLYYFRLRAGVPHPSSGKRPQVHFWDTDLKGSNAGRFLMGAGNSLRWIENIQLRKMLNDVINGIEACKNGTYILPFDPPGMMHSEQGDYGRSWLSQGLIEAGKAGNQKAYPLLRELYDWFNDPKQNVYLPYLYANISNGEQGQIPSTRLYLETPVGKWEDITVAQETYRDDFWLNQLINKDAAGIWQYHMPPPNHPHCYEITAFLAFFDQYRATGNTTYLDAVTGAYEIYHDNFEHVGGSASLVESSNASTEYPPKSYRIKPGANTGETCCSVFWLKFNQRFHLLNPYVEKYVSEIETIIYNSLLSQMVPKSGIRYFTNLEGTKAGPNNQNTCCEGQGTRFFGSLPEYIFSISNTPAPAFRTSSFPGSSLSDHKTLQPDGFFVDLFASSNFVFAAQTNGSNSISTTWIVETEFPYANNFSMSVKWGGAALSVNVKVRIRMPSWLQQPLVVNLNGVPQGSGRPGSYFVIDRTWAQNDSVSLVFPIVFQAIKYSGVDQIPGYEGKRFAILVGPVLLACVGPISKNTSTTIIAHDPTPSSIPAWVLPGKAPLHYTIKNYPKFEFMPIWEVPANTLFTTYPIYTV